MNIEEFRNYCLSFPLVTEGFPFDKGTLVFKVSGKMFALTNIDLFEGVNLKCDPERAIELRDQYDAINPGYHMSKKHWNTITMDGSIAPQLFKELVDHSYKLVFNGLPKKIRDQYPDLEV